MKRIGTEDGTREYQPLALEVVGGVDIGDLTVMTDFVFYLLAIFEGWGNRR